MATPRGAEHRDLEARFKRLEDELAVLRTAVLRQRQLSVSEGDFVVSGGGSVIVQTPGDLILADSDGSPVWSASSDSLIFKSAYGEANGLNLSDQIYGHGAGQTGLRIPIPPGYRYMNFTTFVSAGESYSGGGSGNLSVYPALVSENGFTPTGPAINSGNSSISVAYSFWSGKLIATNYGAWIQFGVGILGAGGIPRVAGSGNWHVSAQIVFERGGA